MDFYRLDAGASRSGWRVTLTETDKGVSLLMEWPSAATGDADVREVIMWRGHIAPGVAPRECSVVHLLANESMRRDVIELLDAYLEDVKART